MWSSPTLVAYWESPSLTSLTASDSRVAHPYIWQNREKGIKREIYQNKLVKLGDAIAMNHSLTHCTNWQSGATLPILLGVLWSWMMPLLTMKEEMRKIRKDQKWIEFSFSPSDQISPFFLLFPPFFSSTAFISLPLPATYLDDQSVPIPHLTTLWFLPLVDCPTQLIFMFCYLYLSVCISLQISMFQIMKTLLSHLRDKWQSETKSVRGLHCSP